MNYFLTLTFGLFAFSSLFSLNTQAQPAHWGRCSIGTSYESFGFGVNSGFTGDTTKSRMNDEYCFLLGQNEGQQLRSKYSAVPYSLQSCQNNYQDGFNQGLNADILVIGDNGDCSHSGYLYGQSALSAGARDGNTNLVGQDCVNAYQQGLSDGRTHIGHGAYSNNRDSACYQTGLEDSNL